MSSVFEACWEEEFPTALGSKWPGDEGPDSVMVLEPATRTFELDATSRRN